MEIIATFSFIWTHFHQIKTSSNVDEILNIIENSHWTTLQCSLVRPRHSLKSSAMISAVRINRIWIWSSEFNKEKSDTEAQKKNVSLFFDIFLLSQIFPQTPYVSRALFVRFSRRELYWPSPSIQCPTTKSPTERTHEISFESPLGIF